MAIEGVGTQVIFHTTGFTSELVALRGTGIARLAIEASHMGTPKPGMNQMGNKPFLASRLSDPGMVALTLHYNPLKHPPLDAPAEAIEIRWPRPLGEYDVAIWKLTGFMIRIEVGGALEAVMEATIFFKLTSPIEMTASNLLPPLWTEPWEDVLPPPVGGPLWTETWES